MSLPERIRMFRSNLLSTTDEDTLIQLLINNGTAWTLGDDICEAARVRIRNGTCKLPEGKNAEESRIKLVA